MLESLLWGAWLAAIMYEYRIERDPIWETAQILVALLVAMTFGVNAYSAITYRKD